MGSWGRGSFDNDQALDWLPEFHSSPSERTLLDVFEGVYPRPHRGILDRILRRDVPRSIYYKGESVVAVAEVVAMLSGRPPDPVPTELMDLPEVVIGDEVRKKAIEAVRETLADSELKGCIDEDSPEYEDWVLFDEGSS